MKVLCKDNVSFQYLNESYVFKKDDKYGINDRFLEKDNVLIIFISGYQGYCEIFEMGEYPIKYLSFYKYFYTPEETKCIKRSKLIDEMLK